MKPVPGRSLAAAVSVALTMATIGCSGSKPAAAPTPAAPVTLQVVSTNPASGLPVTVSPSDNMGMASGQTPLSLSYAAGTSVTLTAPASTTASTFSSWTGCASVSATACTVTLSASTTVTANYTPVPATFQLAVASTGPASGVAVAVSPADSSGVSTATTPANLSYVAGATVTLTAPATAGQEVFSDWKGCNAVSARVCTVLMNGNASVTADYKSPVSVTVSPASSSVTVGSSQQFTASVSGASNTAVTWSVTPPAGSTLRAGTISSTGLYQTPFPAPPTVTITATSVADPTASASVSATLTAPATATGPTLTVNTATVMHTISPLIYGMNSYSMDPTLQAQLHIPVDRWGGDLTTRYNYQLDVSNSASDYYYENAVFNNNAYPDTSQFNTQASRDKQYGSKTLASVPLIGYTSKRASVCSYSVAKYGAQKVVDPNRPDCGMGIRLDGTAIANDPADTSTPIDQTFDSQWVTYLVNKFGRASAGGVAIYELDNEPEYYSAVHKDVHPAPLSYDELTGKAVTYATAIKAADPTALISGPAISNWQNYFYSPLDQSSGYVTPPYVYNANPKDRLAHGDTPLLAYYLQQMAKADAGGAGRLLDYLDIHTYFAAAGTAFNPAGDTALQAARLNSTRVFWDPAYTDPAYTDPNVRTNGAPAYAPQLIPLLKGLVAANYPGTKTAITEYNWGALESVNGALAQMDILGLFGAYGLDMGMLWGPPNPTTQVPGVLAFRVFQDYDGHGNGFGDGSLSASSTDQGKVSIYAARRSSDNALTLLVLNKTFGDVTAPLSLETASSTAQVFTYSNANPQAITAATALTLTPGTNGNASATLALPAQSATLLVLAK